MAKSPFFWAHGVSLRILLAIKTTRSNKGLAVTGGAIVCDERGEMLSVIYRAGKCLEIR